jgi:hypothetical protein
MRGGVEVSDLPSGPGFSNAPLRGPVLELDGITAVAGALVQRPSCAPCLASTRNLALAMAGSAIDRLMRLGLVTLDVARCPGCQQAAVAVYRMTGRGAGAGQASDSSA